MNLKFDNQKACFSYIKYFAILWKHTMGLKRAQAPAGAGLARGQRGDEWEMLEIEILSIVYYN